MNKDAPVATLNDLLPKLRALLPSTPATYGQARVVAQSQAIRIGKLLGRQPTRLPLDWIERIPGVSVTMVGANHMEELTKRPDVSGATEIRPEGTYRIYINKNNSITHCRFTLAHELYHVISGPFEHEIFGDFGHGDRDRHTQRKERVADHFAANLLMPGRVVRKAWNIPIHGVRELAAVFGVSEDAMRIRLMSLGYIDNGLTKEMLYRRPRLIARRGTKGRRHP